MPYKLAATILESTHELYTALKTHCLIKEKKASASSEIQRQDAWANRKSKWTKINYC